MTVALFLFLVAVLVLFIVGIVKCIKRKDIKLWLGLFIAELTMIFVARGLMQYYDDLPGTDDWMPGFTYLGEYLLCYGALWAYGIMLGVSVICCFVLKKR